MKDYYLYIVSNWTGDVIYTGVTNNFVRRLYEHKTKVFKGFTSKYNLDKLVYYEQYNDVTFAIEREKEIKKWRREKKNRLIETLNPEWRDLSDSWYEDSSSLRSFGMIENI